MAGLSSPGIGSGLDINGLVKRLMEVERLPLSKLAKEEANHQARITAFGSLKGAFSAFQTASKALTSVTRFNTSKATAADATVLSATASSIAKPGSYSLAVSRLAQQHKLASAAFDDPATAIGTGTLTIDFGTHDSVGNSFTVNAAKTAQSITIGSSNNSLAGVRDAINQAKVGVTASIVNDGEGYRLALSSNDAGRANSLRILVSGDGDGQNADNAGLSRLAFNPTGAAGTGKNLTQTLAAQNAEFTIDGIFVSKPTNVIGDAIPGVTLNLLKTTEAGASTTLTIARDTAGVKGAVEGFVKAYNELATTMRDLGGYDPKTQKGGLLQGDATLRGLQTQLRNMLSGRIAHSEGGVSTLSDIGVSFERDGSLSLDAGKLDKVLTDPSKNVASLFATVGVPSDSLISYGGASSATQPGRYGIDISRVATRATATGSLAVGASTDITTGANDQISLKLNGATTTVTLAAGTYTRDQLVAELQSKINGATAFQSSGHRVGVAHAGGVLTLTSTLYGGGSRVEILGGNAAATLFGTASSTAGEDVAGTIGGQPATGKGQLLTGTGSVAGLQLLIEGGATGARGTVGFAIGLATQLDRALGQWLETGGALGSRTDGIERSIKDIGSRREIIERRLEQIEKRYKAQFNALDQVVASMQQTSQYLTQQLANLSSLNKSN